MTRWRRVAGGAAVSLPLIAAVAFALRAGFAWEQALQIPFQLLGNVPFRQETGNIAAALAQGRGFSDALRGGTGATAWLTPAYPLLLAGIFRVFGIFTAASFIAAVTANVVFSTATCIPIFFVGRKIGGVAVGALAAWFWAIFPNAILIPFEWIWDTCLATLLAALLLWLTLRLAEGGSWRAWCGYGLLWGLALMTNPALGALLPFLLIWAAYRAHARGRPAISRAVVAALLVVLCCAPWTVRNYARFHRFVPLRSVFPFALWLGHNPVWNPASPPDLRVTPYEESREYARLGETAFMREKWRAAVRFIRAHPGLEVQLFERRFVAFWAGLDAPVRHFRETSSLLVKLVLLANGLAAVGTLAGLWVVWRWRRRYAIPLSAFPVVFPWVYYATQPYLRYRQPIDPVLMLLAALTVAALIGRRTWARQ